MLNFSKITSYLTLIFAIFTIAITIYTSKLDLKPYLSIFFLFATLLSYIISRNLISKEFFSKDKKTKEEIDNLK